MKINAAFPVFLLLVLCCCSEKPQDSSLRPQASTGGTPAVDAKTGDGTSFRILPEIPTSSDCLRVLGQGQFPKSGYIWRVNGQQVATSADNQLCSDAFRRGDRVVVQQNGSSVSVTIANSPPKVTGITATPDQVFAGSDVQVAPVGEDRDGDSVDFSYQWLINGEVDPAQTTNTLSGSRFNKGNDIQVRITPYDGIEQGPVYESYKMTIPNAPPRIESNPPQQFAALEYSYQLKATDPDGDGLSWRLDNAPQGATINPASGLITWPLTGVTPGAYSMKIVVSDPDGAEAFQEYTLTLGAPQQ